MLKLDGYGWYWKIPISLAFSTIFRCFFGCPPHLPIHWHPHFCYIKGIQLVHIWAKFHIFLICSSPVLKFQMFSYQQRYNFRLLLSGVFLCNPLKCGQICLKFWPVMQCNIMHQAYDGFYFTLKKHLKLSQKNDFLTHFERFLVYAFLRPMIYIPVFCQI